MANSKVEMDTSRKIRICLHPTNPSRRVADKSQVTELELYIYIYIYIHNTYVYVERERERERERETKGTTEYALKYKNFHNRYLQ